MEKPLVSVVVPIYNVEAYFNRCIGSIVNQTYNNLDIILVDDGSPDKCPQLCDEWAKRDARIRVIHKQNEGVGVARNYGIDKACGKYLLFVDGDDFLDLKTVEKCIDNLFHQKTDIVIFGCCDVDKNEKIVRESTIIKRYTSDKEYIINEILAGMFTYKNGYGISTCMKMFDLNIIRNNKIYFGLEREFVSEDACFILELFKHITSVSVLSENFYFYRKNEMSFSRRFKPNIQTLNDAFLTRAMDICKKNNYPQKVVANIKVRYHMYCIAAMKQVISSELSEKDKRIALNVIFKNKLLYSTVSTNVLKYEKIFSRVFWVTFKIKLFFICRLMLWYKLKH